MNNFIRDIENDDKTIETLVISSNDNNYPLDITKTYKLAIKSNQLENKLVNMFKNSILGAEIGVKAEGFSTVAILATIVAVGMFCIMYITFRI